MLNVNFPEPSFRIRGQEGAEEIFDALRKKWIRLTPEEWVRQNLVAWLQVEVKIPAAFIAIEKTLQIGDKTRRFDLLAYNQQHQPWMLVECKAMDVPLSEKVLQQALSMFSVVPASYVLISNGQQTMGWHAEEGHYKVLEALPSFENWQ
jgi:hypothetical protein